MSDWQSGQHRATIQKRLERFLPHPFVSASSHVIEAAQQQLADYFSGRRRSFDVPVAFYGTPFQCDVWRALCCVGFGQTVSYGAIAAQIGRPKAVRAAGVAVGENALSVIVPCHRIVGANGSLTGYGGGLKAKTYLLNLEGGWKNS